MQIVDALATILQHEGVKLLSCFPTTPMIQACAAAGIRPQVCAQERVGGGIADG
jgi:acetolactate synthase-1/2/3 large subunit